MFISILVMASCSYKRTPICLVKNKNTGLSSVCTGSSVLQCDEKQHIRISSITLHRHSVNGDRDCAKCDINKSNESENDEKSMKIQHELMTGCSYVSNCTLTTKFTTLHGIKKKHMWYIDVMYSCVDQG